MNQKIKKKKTSLAGRLLLLLNLFTLFLLLASYAAYYLNPLVNPYLPFAGLAYPYILAANAFFLLIWIFFRVKYALLNLIFILLGWNHIGRLVQFSSSESGQTSERGIRVLSYNIQNFLKVNTSTTKYITDFTNRQKITDFIKNQDADIICLQEVLYDKSDLVQFVYRLGKVFGTPNHYHENYFRSRSHKMDAIATFTRYRIVHKGCLVHNDKTIGIFTDLVLNKDTVRVYNLHLASLHFQKEDYDFLSELSPQQEQEKIRYGTLQILQKIRLAFEKRAVQTGIVENHINSCLYPVIICGDFNDTPTSYSYRIVAKGMNDAFTVSGRGWGSTFAGRNFPALRIDYIFHDDHFTSAKFMRHNIPLSDHYPVSCTIYPAGK